MKIAQLIIKNFRGIKELKEMFFDKDFICLVGRGDTGKSTILEAISYVLSPSWNITFYDNDFYKCNTDDPIEIEVSLIDIPEELLQESKYGLHIRGLDKNNRTIIDDPEDEHEKVITLRLKVEKDLEPSWSVVNERQEPKSISAHDRAKMNTFMISDYIDKHFSWNKGSPLSALLKAKNEDDGDGSKDKIIEAVRNAKQQIDNVGFDQFKSVTEDVKKTASEFGLFLENTKTSIDFKDISIKEGRVCLHDDKVPFRLKGKGTKRLLSSVIQIALTKHAGIILIDELEQGLEPDRIKQLVRTLTKGNHDQVFITTHSREVITELKYLNIAIIKNTAGNVSTFFPDEEFQGVIRACPEAFFSKKVIVCEGKTEVGICRALDNYRKENQKEYMSFKGCVVVEGNGSNFSSYAHKLKVLGFDTIVFCDSDRDINPTKQNLENEGIVIADCEGNNAIEKQVFTDLPHEGIKELIEYVLEDKEKTDEELGASVKSKYDDSSSFPADWKETDTINVRKALAQASIIKDKEWFKRIDHGEFLGETIFKYFDQMSGKHLKTQLEKISNWIDDEQ